MPTKPPTFKRPAMRRPVEDARPSAYRRGYGGKAWQSLRARVYTRDNGCCKSCGHATGKPGEAHIDHIIPKSAGGADAMGNLQLLCRSCHSKKTARERRGVGMSIPVAQGLRTEHRTLENIESKVGIGGIACKHCGKTFRPNNKRGPKPRFCSERCRFDSAKGQTVVRDSQKCRGCGKTFSDYRVRKYCSDDCGKSFHYESRLHKKRCLQCAMGFESKSRHAKYCSNSCRSSARAIRFSLRPSRPTKKCKGCGAAFEPKKGNNKGLYCSRECAYENQNQWNAGVGQSLVGKCTDVAEATKYVRKMLAGWKSYICRLTGERVSRPNSLSEKGREMRKDLLSRSWRSPRFMFECQSCGDKFVRIGSKGSRETCSRCIRNRNKQNSGGNHRKRARRHGVSYEAFSHNSIFERDNYKCQLCGVECKKKEGFPGHYHDEMVTLDHIIPLARGGDHKPGNCWTLCAGCNSEKGDQGPVSYCIGKNDSVRSPRFYNHIETLRSRRSDAFLICGWHSIDRGGQIYASDAAAVLAWGRSPHLGPPPEGWEAASISRGLDSETEGVQMGVL